MAGVERLKQFENGALGLSALWNFGKNTNKKRKKNKQIARKASSTTNGARTKLGIM